MIVALVLGGAALAVLAGDGSDDGERVESRGAPTDASQTESGSGEGGNDPGPNDGPAVYEGDVVLGSVRRPAVVRCEGDVCSVDGDDGDFRLRRRGGSVELVDPKPSACEDGVVVIRPRSASGTITEDRLTVEFDMTHGDVLCPGGGGALASSATGSFEGRRVRD